MSVRPMSLEEQELVGNVFGRLTVVTTISKRNDKGVTTRNLLCLCSCGNMAEPVKGKVLCGEVLSCGCLGKELQKSLGDKSRKPAGESALHSVYSTYKKSAKIRDYSFNLSKDQFKDIVTQPCNYCGNILTNTFSGKCNTEPFLYTGIDRYDNTLGYEVSNCVPCCKICNRIKSDLTIEQLKSHLIKMQSNKDSWVNYKETKGKNK